MVIHSPTSCWPYVTAVFLSDSESWSQPGDLAEYVIPGRNGYIVDAANSREVAAAIEKACANAHSMCEACIASMVPYDEGVINAMIVKQIFSFGTQ